MPGEKFVTPYGVVQVVADDRAASCSDEVPAHDKSQASDTRKDSLTRRKNRIFIAAAKYQRRRRQKFFQLFSDNVTGEKLQEEVWKEYCRSTTPAAILSGSWSWKTHKESAKVPLVIDDDAQQTQTDPSVDKVTKLDVAKALDEKGNKGALLTNDRVIECVLIKDKRRKVIDLDDDMQDDGRLTKFDVAKAVVEKGKKEASLMNKLDNSITTHCSVVAPNSIHESGMKLYLQRRLLDERYNENIPIYECFRCGRSFSSRLGLKGHLNQSVCEKKSEQLMRDRLERLEMIEKGLGDADLREPQRDKKQPVAMVVVSSSLGTRKIKSSVFKKLPGWIVFHANRSSIYPEVQFSPFSLILQIIIIFYTTEA